jgi:arylsulfatase A-like enzyme
VIGDWAQRPTAADLRADSVAPSRVDLQGEALLSARAGYFGLINHVDDQIRRLLNPVDGIPSMTGDNTVYVFTSDHGEMLGDHYQWRKSQAYEPSARIPLIIRGPARMKLGEGRIVDEAVCLEDIMPTVLDIAGVGVPSTVQGRSLVPLLRGEKPAWREYLHLECAPYFQALTDGREKYVWLVDSGTEQLFDLVNDPNERHNLIASADYAQRVPYWRSRLMAELTGRPEGFTDGKQLVPGRPYGATLPHAGKLH